MDLNFIESVVGGEFCTQRGHDTTDDRGRNVSDDHREISDNRDKRDSLLINTESSTKISTKRDENMYCLKTEDVLKS